MRKLQLGDIHPLSEYEGIRNEMREQIIQIKKARRLQIGDLISMVFENRETVIFQIQEMMRAEHIYDDTKIQGEIDTFNPLIPDENELSATLFIEITDQEKIKKTLDKLQGLDRENVLFFQMGDQGTISATFEEGRSNEEKISSVHYVKFSFTKEQQDLFSKMEIPVQLVINHPYYQKSTTLTPETRMSLLADFK
ncbi:MAG TPA: DUF3501 family protein [Nitrospiria bacterium]